jgi:hypothetical protein
LNDQVASQIEARVCGREREGDQKSQKCEEGGIDDSRTVRLSLVSPAAVPAMAMSQSGKTQHAEENHQQERQNQKFITACHHLIMPSTPSVANDQLRVICVARSAHR